MNSSQLLNFATDFALALTVIVWAATIAFALSLALDDESI